MRQPQGTLISIGRHEDEHGDMAILRRVADCADNRRLAVPTIGSSEPAAMWAEFRSVFQKLGVKDVVHLPLGHRREALSTCMRAPARLCWTPPRFV